MFQTGRIVGACMLVGLALGVQGTAHGDGQVITQPDREFRTGFQGAFPRFTFGFYDDAPAQVSWFVSGLQFNGVGRVWQFQLDGGTLSDTPVRFFDGEENLSEFGTSVAYGNFLGDERKEVAIGAPAWGNDRGKVNYYTPTVNGFQFTASYTGPEADSRYGISLRSFQLPGENFAGLFIGHSGTNDMIGAVDLVEADDKGNLPEQPVTFLNGIGAGGEFGRFMHTFTFDPDGPDRQDCFVADAPNETVNDNVGAGVARVYELGRDQGNLTAELRVTFSGWQPNQFLGCKIWYVAGQENFLLLGSEFDETNDENGNGVSGEPDVGYVGAFLHTPQGFNPESPAWEQFGPSGEGFAFAVGSADWNGDGWGDITVGSPFYNGINGDQVGKMEIFLGSDIGFSDDPDCTIEGQVAGGLLGSSIAYGDFDSDGDDDIASVAPLASHDVLQEGAAYAYFGDTNSIRFMCEKPQFNFEWKEGETTVAMLIGTGQMGDVALLLLVPALIVGWSFTRRKLAAWRR